MITKFRLYFYWRSLPNFFANELFSWFNYQALTRDKTVGRAPNPLECELLRDSKEQFFACFTVFFCFALFQRPGLFHHWKELDVLEKCIDIAFDSSRLELDSLHVFGCLGSCEWNMWLKSVSQECKNQGEHCKMYESCMTLASKKYRAFPYTGLEIMQAYAGDDAVVTSSVGPKRYEEPY